MPFLRAIKKRDMKKHNAPLKTQNPAKTLGRHHINDDVSKAPAIGVPIKPPIPVKVKQTPNRAPISESLSAVDPTTGASRPIYDPEKNP